MQLFFDEAQYWSWGTALDFGYFSKPPLLAWIIRGFTEICGTGEACIRFASPVLYALTGLVCGILSGRMAARMGGSQRAAIIWGTVLFATLPGVTFASRLISTDAPLLLCFALSLLFLDRLRERTTLLNAAGLGIAVGLGFMAKYAMVYFVLCFFIWALISREGRRVLLQPVLLLAFLMAVAIIAPNIWWNASNDWITFQHTGDNANWDGLTFHFDNMAEFVGAQIGILGPLLFLILLIGLVTSRGKHASHMTFLLCFSVPVILLMLVQATIARAHANWAAVAFVALTVLTVSWAVSWRAKPLLLIAGFVHLVAFGIMSTADIYADRLLQARVGYAYKRVFGWQELGLQVEKLAKENGVRVLVADRRNTAAQLLYYLRDSDLVVRTWPPDGLPRNYYEMAIPLSKSDTGPLMVLASCPAGREAKSIKALSPISIAVRPRFGITVYPYLAPDAGLSKTDIC